MESIFVTVTIEVVSDTKIDNINICLEKSFGYLNQIYF